MCGDEKLVLGVDEAGRGPIIGPMYVCGVVVDEKTIDKLRLIGVTDSKRLNRDRREKLFSVITNLAKHVLAVEVPPQLIDAVNLNVLERDTIAVIVARALNVWREKLTAVYVDAVGVSSKLVSTIRKTGFRGTIVIETKADSKYVVVGAASIVAKVLRDRTIEELRRLYGVEGSGYPTDQRTLNWIKKAYTASPYNPPPFIRRTWGVLRQIAPSWYVEKKAGKRCDDQRSLLDYLSS